MNCIYRSIWNDATGTFVAVSENARSAGRRASTCNCTCASGGGAATAIKALAISLMMVGAGAWAAPVNGVVTAGGATIGGAPGSLVIKQSTQSAAINWQSFNVAAGESVRFIQPNSNAVALNRVLGSDPSSILGTLIANGKVFLINPNGILFGKGASVNVGGLVASSLNISDADFMAGNFRFSGAGAGTVANHGAINAPGGQVALLGANVSNDGVITARLGSVALAAGNAITLDVAGDGLLNVAINQGAVNALVQNGGLIQADGGQVLLSARAAGGLLQGGVNNSGVIQARSLENRNGVIRLVGDAQSGAVQVGGTLDASGLGPGQSGGLVQVLGNSVNLNGATVNASGDAGGGTVLIGGDFRGGAALPSARATVLAGATVHADAISTGDGGRIAIWSDDNTAVNATLTARGGASGGNGGFIETSGKNVVLGADNSVNTLAPKGKTGTWLLDPTNWKIADSGGDETPADVRTSLASSDRQIMATNDITVADALVWTTGQKLELNAGHDVLVKAAITASTAGSAIVLMAGNDVLVDAAMTASATGSRIIMSAGRDITDTAAITATATGAKISMTALGNVSVTTVTADGGGSADLVAGGNVTANGKISSDNGAVLLIADNDGTGPGIAGGTVTFVGPASVSAMATTIRFNPATYAGTSTEIANYATKVASGSLDAKAWVFAQGDNKVYNGNRTATLSLRGNPDVGNSVALTAGTASFNDKNVGTSKPIIFNGYTLSGADLAKFALFAPFGTAAGSGTTTASITPAPLTVTATNATKTYGQTLALSPSAFTPTGLVNGETIGSVTETSAGTVANASVAGSTYAITPSNATGGTFSASNYTITYGNGALTVTPAPLTVTASDVSKPYGQTLVPTAFTTDKLLNGETIGSVTETSAGTPATAGVAGSPYPIIPINATGGTFTASNYAITYVNGKMTVTPRALTVTASDATKPYGQSPVLTGFTTTGLVNGDSVASVTETSPGTVAGAAPGQYAITPSSATGGTFTPANYAIVYTNGGLTVSTPVVVPPVVAPPAVMPPPVVVGPSIVVPPVTPSAFVPDDASPTMPPVETSVTVIQTAPPTGPMPVIVLLAPPVGLQSLPPPTAFNEPQPQSPAVPAVPAAPMNPAVPATHEVPVTKRAREPAVDVPLHRVRKQDRN